MNRDIQNLLKYPEFYALKKAVLDHIQKTKDNITRLDVSSPTFQLTVASEIRAVKVFEEFMADLGVIEKISKRPTDKTYN